MNVVRKFFLALGALVIMASLADFAWSQDKEKTAEQKQHELAVAKATRQGFASPGWGAGLGAGLVIIGAGIGFGRIGGSALESMARQPETAGRVQTAMIIIGALLEGATFFGLIVCIIIAGNA